MKTLRGAFIVAFLLSGIIPAYPVDVSLGATAWYVRWSPNFENKLRGKGNGITASAPANMSGAYDDRFEADPVFMGGPVLNLKLSGRWSLGLVALMSQEYTITSSYRVDQAVPADTFTSKSDMTFRRYDSDITANYRVASWLVVFGGVKYLRWTGTGDVDVADGLAAYFSHTDTENLGQALGPALGLGLTVPLVEALYLTASGSFLYMRSKEEQEISLSENAGPFVTTTTHDSLVYSGFNGMAGLGYYLGSLQTSLIIGARYQYLKNGDNPKDSFSGITATVVYSF
jgi:hypothetical protein